MILSRKEYEEKAKLVVVQPQEAEEESKSSASDSHIDGLHFLMYPENVEGKYHNGEYKLDFNGNVLSLMISDGVVRTGNSEIKDALIRDGFIYMYSRKHEVE